MECERKRKTKEEASEIERKITETNGNKEQSELNSDILGSIRKTH